MQFKDMMLVQQPCLQDMHVNNAKSMAQNSTNPSPSSPYGLAFGSCGLDFLDTATLFVVLFQNCLQSSFLCRLGVKVTATVSVLQWIVFACSPLVFPHGHPSWLYRLAVSGIWTAHLIRSSYVWQSEHTRHTQFLEEFARAVAHRCKDFKDGQSADSVLNHMLKNCMADASGCIDVFQNDRSKSDLLLLSKACDILFRGMWWCKAREAILALVAGRYKTEVHDVNLQKFSEDLIRGRDVALESGLHTVELDPLLCNVILDNAVTNAFRHGCPRNPEVYLAVEVFNRIGGPFDADIHQSSSQPVKVRFLLRNRANPRNATLNRWSTAQSGTCVPSPSSCATTLSGGLGLKHIRMVANSCGMVAELWQTGADVFFELCVSTKATFARPDNRVQSLTVAYSFPPALNILGLDDSSVARKSLRLNLEKAIPDAAIFMYGEYNEEVEQFKEAALEKGDILILDEHVDIAAERLLGSSIVKELRDAGYQGFACIRSGNSTEADKARSVESGANWHVGKDVRINDMIRQLHTEYQEFLWLKREKDRLLFNVPQASSRVTFAEDVEPPRRRIVTQSSLSCKSSSVFSDMGAASQNLLFAPPVAPTETESSRGTSRRSSMYGVMSLGGEAEP